MHFYLLTHDCTWTFPQKPYEMLFSLFSVLTCPNPCVPAVSLYLRPNTNLGLVQPVRRLTVPLGPDWVARWVVMVFWWSAAAGVVCYVR